MIGTKLKNGEYTIERELGKGGEGPVFLARNRLGKQYAIKTLSLGMLSDPSTYQRFWTQAKQVAELSQKSEHLVEVFDHFVESMGLLEVPCMVMEYLAGGSLAARLQATPTGLDIAHVQRWMLDVTQALDVLHREGLLHRDLKPANVLLRTKGRETAVLTDFGMMADLDDTSSGNKATSAGYFPPEQWILKTKEQDQRLDLYALGMTMYRLLTGRWPYSFQNAENYFAQLGRVAAVPPSQWRPELLQWPGLENLILELIAVDREQRPPDAQTVRRRLEALRAAQDDQRTIPRVRKGGEKWVNPKDGLTYVWIPPGRFRMGCSEGDTECWPDEKPAREVVIAKGFWLGETPVTQEAYRKVMGKDPSYFKGDRRPVEQVSWEEAKRYCELVGGRLPREAEWEYAARAGTSGARYGELAEIGWYEKNSGGETHEVKGKAPNGFGLYDVIGNVWEWVDDWYDGGWYGKARGIEGPPSGDSRVLRGGSWYYIPRYARASVRDFLQPEGRFHDVGFRCAGDWL